MVTGQKLVNSRELESFKIGAHRFTTPGAIDRFVKKCIEESANETAEQRAARVAPAVAARQRKRALARAGA